MNSTKGPDVGLSDHRTRSLLKHRYEELPGSIQRLPDHCVIDDCLVNQILTHVPDRKEPISSQRFPKRVFRPSCSVSSSDSSDFSCSQNMVCTQLYIRMLNLLS